MPVECLNLIIETAEYRQNKDTKREQAREKTQKTIEDIIFFQQFQGFISHFPFEIHFFDNRKKILLKRNANFEEV